ncbi:anthocyanidin reductase-like [Panicum miliaceum]|uniref:Anthocyanidin reductase-like n=1 Tax=Panicum miliaceum TaxID=4540 RepID=A0A3L6T9T2_PANMI|nr:anthocyanidin reductase-like [Panicum miliaceum]
MTHDPGNHALPPDDPSGFNLHMNMLFRMQYKNTTEATVDAARIILRQCERSGTVRRVIHTASVTAASPLREDGGGGYKDFINESCWTPLNLSYGFSNVHLDAYVSSKSLSEQELLRYNDGDESSSPRTFEVVSLACALVGGDTIQPRSSTVIVAPLTGHATHHNSLLFLQALLGSVPLAHVEDVCEAHAFCMDQPAMAGRFLCAAGYPSMRDILDRFATRFPEIKIQLQQVTGEGVRVRGDTRKLEDLGFRYRYGVEETVDCSVECAKRLGELQVLYYLYMHVQIIMQTSWDPIAAIVIPYEMVFVYLPCVNFHRRLLVPNPNEFSLCF